MGMFDQVVSDWRVEFVDGSVRTIRACHFQLDTCFRNVRRRVFWSEFRHVPRMDKYTFWGTSDEGMVASLNADMVLHIYPLGKVGDTDEVLK